MQYDPDAALRQIRAAESVVVGQIGQTLDGRVATESGESLYINGENALEHLHRLRAAVDAVIVGVGTIIADDPRLTVRLAEGRTPVRVVLDPSGRMPAACRCLSDGHGGVLVIRRADHSKTACCVPDAAAETAVIDLPPAENGLLSWPAIVDALAERGLRRILIEGGPRTLSLALAAGAIDLLHVMIAPKILGSGRNGLVMPPVARLADALAPACETWRFEDGDMLFACDLRREP